MSRAGASPPRLLVATSNRGKLREIREILHAPEVTLSSLDEVGGVCLPAEGDDYAANARGKARAAAEASGLPALADDSGLEVSGLAGAPGPRSARYGGPDLDDAGRVAHLLRQMEGLEGAARRARFVCVAALASPGGGVVSARGECPGRIRRQPAGAGGFGYDPVFEPEGMARTLAELPAAEKHRLSHRGHALRALAAALRGLASG